MSESKTAKPEAIVPHKYYRPAAIAELLGISIPTFYRYVKQKRFPKPTRIGPNITGILGQQYLDFVESVESKRKRL